MDDIIISAVHEAAHCVVAEFVGFEVKKVEVTSYKNSATIDYGIYKSLIVSLFTTDSLFRIGQLDDKNHESYISLFENLLILLVSGNLAAVKVKNPESKNFTIFQYSDERDDISRISRIINFCNYNDIPKRYKCVEDVAKICFLQITHPKIWQMIMKLTALILQSPHQTMEVSQLNEFFSRNTEEFKIVKSDFSNYISKK